MRRVHPLWRGFFAALALSGSAAALLYEPDGALTLACGTAAGALLCSLPGRIRGRIREAKPGLRRLGVCFLSGMALQLGLAMLGPVRLLPALLTGSVGAASALAAALASGFLLLRLRDARNAKGRRRQA